MFGLSEFHLFVATLAVVGVPAAIYFVLRQKRLNAPNHPPFFGYGEDVYESTALAAARDKFRDGGTIGFKDVKSRMISKNPTLAAPYGKRKPSIFLTPRQLERVNIQRKLRGRQPLNRAGFSNAVAHAWDQPIRQPDTATDWLTYLILYEVLWTDHATARVSVDTGLTITPEAPYNGHGGDFAGAGASGQWTAPDAPTGLAAAAIADGSYGRGGASHLDPLSDPNSYKGSTDNLAPDGASNVQQPDSDKYQPGDHVGGYGDGGYPQSQPSDPASTGPGPSYTDLGQQAATYTPDPSPASAPDPSPSYSPDPSPSAPSFDSSPSPTFDTPSFDPGTSTI